ncbi:MAG: transglutaminase-like cysteine peptidase [Pseudomonadota bacterium]
MTSDRKKRQITALSVCVAILAGASSPAFAIQANPPSMIETGQTSQPIGHAQFCAQYADECHSTRKANPMVLTQARWDELVDINALVNHSIEQLTDQQIYNVVEHWTYPDRVGDCEDLVLLKRFMLIKRGWKPANLLITVARQPNGEGHAVLTARTDRGDFILDNLRDPVMRWDQTEYRYLKRIARGHSGKWVSINDDRSVITGSIN